MDRREGQSEKLDLSVEHISQLNRECQQQRDHLYNFLKGKFPELSTEERLKYLATILNDHFEEYSFDLNRERERDDGYLIVKFFPKGNSGGSSGGGSNRG